MESREQAFEWGKVTSNIGTLRTVNSAGSNEGMPGWEPGVVINLPYKKSDKSHASL